MKVTPNKNLQEIYNDLANSICEQDLDSYIKILYAWVDDVDALADDLEEYMRNKLNTRPSEVYCGIAQYSPDDEKSGLKDRLSAHISADGFDTSGHVLGLVCRNAGVAKGIEDKLAERFPGINHRYTDSQSQEGKGNEDSCVVYIFKRGKGYKGPKPR